jgi:DNA gyrase inhibitor GyrI
MKTLVAAVLSLFALVIVLAGCKGSRKGYESAPYRVISCDAKLELRDYPAIVVAETPMRGDSGSSFQRLFRYISGQNAGSQKIAMTTPVFMAEGQSERLMSFVMPADIESAPLPKDSAVRLATIPAGRFAVFGFSGSRNAQAEKNALDQLRSWMKSRALVSAGEPIYGYFDPPWTPPFLRRNEVMLRVDTNPPASP